MGTQAGRITEFTIPLRLRSSANLREHWRAKAERVKRERLATWAEGTRWGVRPLQPGERALVYLARIAPRRLDDHDNLRHCLKPVVDEIARLLGVDDARGRRVEWFYAQEKRGVREYGVSVRVWTGPARETLREAQRESNAVFARVFREMSEKPNVPWVIEGEPPEGAVLLSHSMPRAHLVRGRRRA